jgi:NADPH-dependent 2,4-dienoyl-CoA reductase/sulfur reductase-like enzyme/peroxiredoxin family protein/rhodanese-related sulfurtransferase/TusA-related sulfurtransferase
MKTYIIVGGVAGGATAAARLRRLDEKSRIILLEKGPYISFANCGLPYYAGEIITDRSRLLVETPEAFRTRYRVDVRTGSEVTSVDPLSKTVTVKTSGGKAYTEKYDALLLSPGARPMQPDIPGIRSSKIISLRSVPDADTLKSLADRGGRAAVIGGGFIGVETAENLIHRGLQVTLIQAAPHLLAPFDSDMIPIAEREMEQNGVRLLLHTQVDRITEADHSLQLHLNSGDSAEADFAVLAAGIIPETAFLQNSGITLSERGFIQTDSHMRTSVKDIYAVGDAVEVTDILTGNKKSVALAGPANRQARIAAGNMTGRDETYPGAQGSMILKIFDLTAAATGLNERDLQKLHQSCRKIIIHPASHAGYYPGSTPLSLKLIFSPEGKVLGAQALGYAGVDKRIDVIASVIRRGGTVYDLTDLELAYAPPYSSAKDPVNMAGYVAEDVLEGLSDIIAYEDLPKALEQGARLLDVRTPEEYERGHLDGAVNMPLDEIRTHIHELDRKHPLIVYCQVGLRGYLAERILKQNGFSVQNLTGGYTAARDQSFHPGNSGPVPSGAQMNTAVHAPESAGITLDLTGLSCPGPLMKLSRALPKIEEGTVIEASASDPGFYNDCEAWCRQTGCTLLKRERSQGRVTAWIRKGTGHQSEKFSAPGQDQSSLPAVRDDKTIIVFSGDLDKVLASFVIANGALSMGKKVTMFFTFWGLNVLRRSNPVPVRKTLIEKCFGWMMPRGSRKLKLSRMNMMGAGTEMMRKIMKEKNISSLEDLIRSAQAGGARMIACQMSMDVMGIRKEELIDGVEIGGVGTFLGAAEDANMSLFI